VSHRADSGELASTHGSDLPQACSSWVQPSRRTRPGLPAWTPDSPIHPVITPDRQRPAPPRNSPESRHCSARPPDGRQPRLTVRQIQSVLHASTAAAEHAQRQLAERASEPWNQTASAWVAARLALASFTEGAEVGPRAVCRGGGRGPDLRGTQSRRCAVPAVRPRSVARRSADRACRANGPPRQRFAAPACGRLW